MAAAATATTGAQFGRTVGLIVADVKLGKGLDLSQMHFRFYVRQCDTDIPNTMVVRIYNLSRETEHQITTQYTSIALQCGYVGTSLEMLFSGDIKYFRRGKENATDRFLEITAGDNDAGYNYGFLQTTLGPNTSREKVISACAEKMGADVDQKSIDQQNFDSSLGGALPRGKVLNGLGRIYLDQAAATANAAGAKWFIETPNPGQPGVLKFVSTTGYLPGNVVVLTPATGLIQIPEATIDGIEFKCLIRGALKIGCQVQIDEDTIVQTFSPAVLAPASGGGVNPITLPQVTNSITTVAKPTPGLGTYRLALIEHSGDTRGQEWYSSCTALTIDKTAPPANSVKPTGSVVDSVVNKLLGMME